jgi:hypothetical protein
MPPYLFVVWYLCSYISGVCIILFVKIQCLLFLIVYEVPDISSGFLVGERRLQRSDVCVFSFRNCW